MGLFTDEIDELIRELTNNENYKTHYGTIDCKMITQTINNIFNTEYTERQIISRNQVLKGYNQRDDVIARKRVTRQKIANRIYSAIEIKGKYKYGREILNLKYKEMDAFLKDTGLCVDHKIAIPLDYIEDLCRASGYSWKKWSDVPTYLQNHLISMCNDIDNLQLITRDENLEKRNFSNRTKHL